VTRAHLIYPDHPHDGMTDIGIANDFDRAHLIASCAIFRNAMSLIQRAPVNA